MDRARKVRKILPVSPCDIRGLEAWLEEQANAGLFPVSIGSWAVFTADGVPGTRFRLEPYDQGRTAPTEEQRELYRRAGWSYALNVAPAGCWLFYTADPAAVELYSDHESRGLSLERLEQAARRAWQRSLLLGVVLAAVSVWLLLFWSGGMAARGGLPLVWLRVFDPTFLVLLLCQGAAFGRSCRNAGLLRRACQALRQGMDMPPSAGPSGRIVWENVISLAAVFLLALLLAGQWMERRSDPLEDFRQLLRAGADKISVNSAAVKDPGLISRAAERFGSQCVVLAIDARRRPEGSYEVVVAGGRTPTGLDAVEWARRGEALGAGEILLTSMDADGTKAGFDLEMTRAVTQAVSIPVIASGGCGSLEHFAQVFAETDCDAALAASLFHFGELTVPQVKEYLRKRKIPVR